jgi:hypothetical protein
VAVNVAETAEAGTSKDAGTVTPVVRLLAKVTVAPPERAALERVTVQVVDVDALRIVLAQFNSVIEIPLLTEIVVDLLLSLKDADTVELWVVVTAPAVAVKFADVPPAGISTDAGTFSAEGTLLSSATPAPPMAAGADKVTVQVVVAKALKLLLAQANELTETVLVPKSVTDLFVPFSVAVTVALWFVRFTAVAIKVALVAEAGTRTDTGTASAEVRLLDKATVAPPSDAALESVTVQVVVAAIARLVLAQFRELTEIGAEVTDSATDLETDPRVAVTLGF